MTHPYKWAKADVLPGEKKQKNKKTKQKKTNKKNISEVDPSNNNFWRDHDILFAIMMVL